MTKLKTLNIEFKNMNLNHLKSMLLFCFESETQKAFKNVSESFNHSEVVNISKNFDSCLFQFQLTSTTSTNFILQTESVKIF